MTSPAPQVQGWNHEAHALWLRDDKQAAIDALLRILNAQARPKPVKLVCQLAYYVFLCGDPKAAAVFLEDTRADHPKDAELLLNLAVCLSRSRQYDAAYTRLQEYVQLKPDDYVAFDSLASTCFQLGRLDESKQAGTQALVLKDKAVGRAPTDWKLPGTSPARWAAQPGKRNVIAFSLWGRGARYLRGAIDNALAAKQVYPGWTPLFFVDDTVPIQVRDKLKDLGAEVRLESPGQPMRQKLAWRFKVANDPKVGRFLVRDVDSVVNERERAAVDEWIASDRWFHAMRDWWTHTDLILAGLWDGVAGVLPDLTQALARYQPPAMETPNVDQWFLRDGVWPYIRDHCLVHDRLFRPPGAQPWPLPDPPDHFHVGQNEYAVRQQEQSERIAGVMPGL